MKHSVKIHGGATYDWLFATADTSKLPNGSSITAEPEWEGNTSMLAKFNGNTSASNYGSSVDLITRYMVYKRKVGDSSLSFVADIPSTEHVLYDYAERSGNRIEYIIYPVYDSDGTDIFMSPVITHPVDVEFNTYSLVELKKYDDFSYSVGDFVWNFCANASLSEFTHNISATVQSVNSKYPYIRKNAQNYVSGSLTAYAGNVTECGKYTEEQSVFDKWASFLNSKNPKLLTDPFGHKYIVEVTASSHEVADYDTPPTSIKFDFVEIADADSFSVFGEERGDALGLYSEQNPV